MQPIDRTVCQVVLVRHGQGFHNLKVDGHSQLHLKDPRLTALGEEEASLAGRELRKRGFVPDIVLASPLTRAMQTAHIAIRSVLESSDDSEQVIFPRITACTAARESNNLNPCNHRSLKSELQVAFPEVDWTDIETEEDVTAGEEANPNLKIQISNYRKRANLFLSILESNQVARILVFAHEGTIRTIQAAVIGLGLDHTTGNIKTGGIAELFLKERPDGTRFWGIGEGKELSITEIILY